MKSHGNWRLGISSKDKDVVRAVGIKVGIALLAFLWLALIAGAWAEAAEGSDRDEYSFSWLDPDKKIYVLQNRRYHKANRLLLSVLGGGGLSNPYRTTWNVEPRLAFYFTEWLGVEAFYTAGFNSVNTTFKALQAASPNALPVSREIRAQYGGLVHLVPWYAKINVFNLILYFDWYFSVGAGQMQTVMDVNDKLANPPNLVNESLFAVYAGTGHQYHLSEWFTVRLDFMGAFYNALSGGNTGEKALFPNYNFGIGLGLRI